eukprot:768657-Hanusia_phi.AAC.15
MSDVDIEVRGYKTHDEYIRVIKSNTLNFNKNDMIKLKLCAKRADKFIETLKYSIYINDLKRLRDIRWRFALVDEVYEEGLPHTRGGVIYLSPRVLEYPERKLSAILLHEKVHIYQRYNNDEMIQNLKIQGYNKYMNRNMIKRARANPDLDEIVYRTPDSKYMVATYKENAKSINDVEIETEWEHPFEMIAYLLEIEYMNTYKE